MNVSGETRWILFIQNETPWVKTYETQYTIATITLAIGYNECSRLFDTVGGKNL